MSFLWYLFIARGIIEIIIDRSKKSRIGNAIFNNSNGSILDSLFPSVSGIKDQKSNKEKIKKIMTGFLTPLFILCVLFIIMELIMLLFYSHVPIIGRKQLMLFSYDNELNIKSFMSDALNITEDTLKDEPILKDKTDYRYCLVHKAIDFLKRACIYYNPKSENYFNNMDVIVVDSPTMNAFSSPGSIIVVYTGIVDFYLSLYKENKIKNVEEAVASVLAHEMGHSLARHSMEESFSKSSIYYYLSILISGDTILIPQIKSMYDNTMSTTHEYEADLIGMYLMKRAGYSIDEYINTLGSLPSFFGTSVDKTIASLFLTHPEPEFRKEALQNAIPQLEEDFKTKYTIEKLTTSQKMDYVWNTVQTTWAWIRSLFP